MRITKPSKRHRSPYEEIEIRKLPQRKPYRLIGYDYSKNGAYFITICVKNRAHIFGHIEPAVGARIARPRLNETGHIVEKAINTIHHNYPCVMVDCYVIMPNHIHMMLVITCDNGRAMRAPTISTVINQMKGYITKQIGFSPWQKLFHDHVIRNEKDYRCIAEYIDQNPTQCQEDCFYNSGKENPID